MKAGENICRNYKGDIKNIVAYLKLHGLDDHMRYSYYTSLAREMIKKYPLKEEVKDILILFKENKNITKDQLALLKKEAGLIKKIEE